MAPQLLQYGGISPLRMAASSLCLMAFFLTSFLLDLSPWGEDGAVGAGSLGGQIGRMSPDVCVNVEAGPTGSLAGTGTPVGPEEAARRRLVGTVEDIDCSFSAVVEWERPEGPAGSLAGTDGSARAPAECERASFRGLAGAIEFFVFAAFSFSLLAACRSSAVLSRPVTAGAGLLTLAVCASFDPFVLSIDGCRGSPTSTGKGYCGIWGGGTCPEPWSRGCCVCVAWDTGSASFTGGLVGFSVASVV